MIYDECLENFTIKVTLVHNKKKKIIKLTKTWIVNINNNEVKQFLIFQYYLIGFCNKYLIVFHNLVFDKFIICR